MTTTTAARTTATDRTTAEAGQPATRSIGADSQRAHRTVASSISPRLALAMITIGGLGIRLIIVRGFWLDEATEADYAKQSFGMLLRDISHDNHPPLHYILEFAIEHLFGTGEFGLRLPSILFGALTIPMMYLAGSALYNRSAGILAALFTALSPLAVWYSQEARMYALFLLMVTITIWAQAQILRNGRTVYWVAWAAASATMIWSQWFAMLAVGTEVLVFLWAVHTRTRDGVAIRSLVTGLTVAVGAVAVVVLPSIPLLLTQFSNNQSNGLGLRGLSAGSISPYGIFNNLVWAVAGYHSNQLVGGIVAVWPLGIFALFLVLGRKRSRSNGMLLAIAVVPMSIVFLASGLEAQGRSLFEVRYFIEIIPALLLLIAGAITTMTPTHLARRVAVGAAMAVLAIGLVLQQTDSGNTRLYGYQWAFSQINAAARTGDRILYDPAFLNVDVDYFSPGVAAFPLDKGLTGLAPSAKVFVVGSFPFTDSQPEINAANQSVRQFEEHRQLLKILRAPNVIVWEFS